jgi:hypothetical protein
MPNLALTSASLLDLWPEHTVRSCVAFFFGYARESVVSERWPRLAECTKPEKAREVVFKRTDATPRSG